MFRLRHTSVSGFPRSGSLAACRAARPTPPSSNRTCGFPASGSPESSRLEHAQVSLIPLSVSSESCRLIRSYNAQNRNFGSCLAFRHSFALSVESLPGSATRLLFASRVATSSGSSVTERCSFKRFSSPFDRSLLPVRPLRSTDITPLLRYYGPLRLPLRPPDRYVFRPEVWLTHCPSGPPRFLGCSVDARRPLSPRRAERLPFLVSSPSVLASSSLADWPLSFLCNEAEPGSLTLRLTPLSPEASPRRITPPCARLTTCLRGIHMADSFQSARTARLILAHQRTQRLN